MSSPIVKNRFKLKQPGETIEDVHGEGMELTDRLFEVLDLEDGIGLAANQIGENKRACVIAVPVKDPETGEVVFWKRRFINPEVVELKDPFIFTKEGCLSFPSLVLQTMRFAECVVKDALHPDGVRLAGLEAVVAQHEIDHTNGITMHDRKIKAIGTNRDCPCNSGKKFKKCCMRKIKTRELY